MARASEYTTLKFFNLRNSPTLRLIKSVIAHPNHHQVNQNSIKSLQIDSLQIDSLQIDSPGLPLLSSTDELISEDMNEYRKTLNFSTEPVDDSLDSIKTHTETEARLMHTFNPYDKNMEYEQDADLDFHDNSLLKLSPENGTLDKGRFDLQPTSEIAREMHLAEDKGALFRAAVTQVRQFFNLDRVLIYRFQSEVQGIVLAEDLTTGYTPSLGKTLSPITFGAEKLLNYQQQSLVYLNDLSPSIPPYQRQMLERFQIRASLSLPILIQGQLWGLFVFQQCSQVRQWSETEIIQLCQIVNELKLCLQGLDFQAERQATALISQKIRRNSNINIIFQAASREAQNLLQVERVAVCQFRPDYNGDFISESKQQGLTSIVGRIWEDSYIQETQGGCFRDNKLFIVDDISQAKLNEEHRIIYKGFEIKACAIVPIFQEQRLWGLLCVYQHSQPRHWQAAEIQFLQQLSNQLGVALQQTELLEEKGKAIQYQQELPSLIDKIINFSDIERICQATVQEVRQMLGVERVAIYKFRPDYFGDFVYESESAGLPKLVGSAWEDPYLQEHQGGRFRYNEAYIADNVDATKLTDCHAAALKHFGIKAFIIVAIKQGETLWGLLSAFQHSGSRHWLDGEANLLAQIGRQLGVALQSTEYLRQLQEQSFTLTKAAQISRTVSEIIPKILQAQSLETVAHNTNQTVRHMLKCDCVVLYRCCPDGRSEPIVESATSLKSGPDFDVSNFWVKAGLQETGTSPYRQLNSLVVNNIYTAGYTAEEIEALEELKVSAYMIAPIFKETQLWGWLGVYQASQPRSWIEAEVVALNQICTQVGTAMLRIDDLERLQQSTEQLVKSTEQERLISRIGERIRQSLDLQQVFKLTTREIRNALKTDRVVVFRFDASSGFSSDYDDGTIIAEDVRSGFAAAIHAQIHDPCFSERCAELYQKGRAWVVTDIYAAGLTDCYLELLAQFQVRGEMVVPLIKGESLWGLFAIHHCSGPRQWQVSEVELIQRIAAQMGIAIQQGEYIEQVQSQSQQIAAAAQRDKAAKEQFQQEVIQLLTAIRPALEGNLTIRAPITESEVGTVADAYNNTLNSMRQIVTQMQTAAQQVVQTSAHSAASINALASQGQQQLQALNYASEQVQTQYGSRTGLFRLEMRPLSARLMKF
jgi:methyl-accepting chemotaxis protein PixJ